MYVSECGLEWVSSAPTVKQVAEPLELQLQGIVSCHRGAGNGTPVLCKNNMNSEPLSYRSNPDLSFLIAKWK